MGEISHNYFISSEYIDSMNRHQEESLLTKDAEDFEKEHKQVLESIRNLVAENSAVKNIVIENLIEGIAKNDNTYNHLFIEIQY